MIKLLKLKNTHLIIFILSFFAFSFSVISQLILDKQPCQLCLVTRFIYLSIAIISFILLFLKNSFFRKILFIAILILISFGFYHLGVENHWWAGPKSCVLELPSLDNVSKELIQNARPHCDQTNWKILGFSSTLLSFLLSSALFWLVSLSYVLNFYIKKKEDEE